MLLPGNVLGLISTDRTSQELRRAANDLGFPVVSLPQKNLTDANVHKHTKETQEVKYQALEKIALRSDFISYHDLSLKFDDIEKIKHLTSVPQGSELLAITQNRLLENHFFEDNNFVIAPYAVIVNPTDIQDAIDGIGYPCVLRLTKKQKSNDRFILNEPQDVKQALALLNVDTCVLEAWLPVEKKVSVTVAKNAQNESCQFPLVEFISKNDGLNQTIVPAQVKDDISRELQTIADDIINKLNFTGILTIQFFLTKTGNIYIHKLIPGPNKYGDFTLNNYSVTQYEAHVRALANWPLPDVKQWSAFVVMHVQEKWFRTVFPRISNKRDWQFKFYENNAHRYVDIFIRTTDIEEALSDIEQIQFQEKEE